MISSTLLNTVPSGEYYFEGVCLSTDDKPTDEAMANGSKLVEMDTSTIYLWDKENQTWRAFE